MNYQFRNATQSDEEALMKMLPRLADFDVPAGRDSKDLWQGDAALMQKALKGETDKSFVIVAESSNATIAGVAIYTLRPELLSSEPSAHLEVLVVHEQHTRQGLGKQLIELTETDAATKGAKSLTLHVFGNNKRARALYEHCGFNEELLRCYKPIAS